MPPRCSGGAIGRSDALPPILPAMSSLKDAPHTVEDHARKLAAAVTSLPPDCNEAELRHRVQPVL